MKINKGAFVKILYSRLEGKVAKKYLIDCVRVICDYVEGQLINDQSIYVNNFGTIFTYTFHGHNGVIPTSNELRYVEPFKNIKFIPDLIFKQLINEKRNNFKI